MQMMKTKKRGFAGRTFAWHHLMILPALCVFLLFVIFPILEGAVLAFTNWDGFSRPAFVGMDNFIRFRKDDQAFTAVKNTVFFGIGGTLLLNAAGLAAALILDSGLRLKGMLRTIVYLPAIISPLIIGYIWSIILSAENGTLLKMMTAMGIGHFYKNLLADPRSALAVIVAVHAWQYAGGNMIIYLAGLQNVPDELIESAKMDGAGYLRQQIFVRLPLLGPSFQINIVTNIIGAMSMFDVIMSLTNGGPGHYTESLSVFIYRLSATGRAGYTSAVSLIMFILVLIPAGGAFWLMQRMNVEK